jgi:hypothetical protein
VRKVLWAGVAAALVWAAIAEISGGIALHVGPVAIRAHGASRPLWIALCLFLIQAVWFRTAFRRETEWLSARLRRSGGAIGILLTLMLTAHAIRFGSMVAGGSDAYGYVSQAYGWARRELPRPIELPLTLPFRASDAMQLPLGHREGLQPHTMVPTYAPGLPLLMATALLVLGQRGAFLVVPASAALFVWFTFRWGRRTGGASGALASALVAVTSPVVLFQAILPMSDVPAGALWTGAAVSSLGLSPAGAAGCGVLTAVGLLVRPNLLPLVFVPLIVIALRRRGSDRLFAILLFGLPVAAAALFIAWLNATWYGSPLRSGYGPNDQLYAWSSIPANLRLYTSWFWESQSGWTLVGLLPLMPPFNRYTQRVEIRVAAAMLLVTLACYLPYQPFDVWWYLRFLLPAYGSIAVLIGSGATSVARMVPRPWGQLAAIAILLVLTVHTMEFAADHDVFGALREGERRYVYIGRFAASALPDNALVFAMQHSGTLRLYGGRYTIRYDFIDADQAAGAPAALQHAGFHPFLIVDDAELPDVRRHFNLSADAPLPWPILGRMRELGGVSVFDMIGDSRTVNPIAIEPAPPLEWCPRIVPLKLPAREP